MPKYLITILILAMSVSAQNSEIVQEKTPPAPHVVSYGIVVDNSGSYRLMLERVIKMVGDLVDENAAEDEAFLVTFVDSNNIVLRQDFTSKKDDLHDAAENMYIQGGQTAILDAVKFSAEHLAANAQKGDERAKAIVLITDGEDRKSISKIDEVIEVLKSRNIRVYAIGIAEGGKVFEKLLDRITKDSGGKKYLPRVSADFKSAVKELSAAIRAK